MPPDEKDDDRGVLKYEREHVRKNEEIAKHRETKNEPPKKEDKSEPKKKKDDD